MSSNLVVGGCRGAPPPPTKLQDIKQHSFFDHYTVSLFFAMTLFFLPAGGAAQASPNTFMPAQPESQKDNHNASKTEGKALKFLVCFSSVIDRDACSLPLWVEKGLNIMARNCLLTCSD